MDDHQDHYLVETACFLMFVYHRQLHPMVHQKTFLEHWVRAFRRKGGRPGNSKMQVAETGSRPNTLYLKEAKSLLDELAA